MTTLDEITQAISNVTTRDLSARLAVRGTTALGAAAGQAARPKLAVYDITNEVKADGFGGQLIVPSKFENDPELFYGPFAELGTYLGIENPALRFVVNAVFDPLNLVLPGTGFLLNKVGRVAHVASASMAAAKEAGLAVKTLDHVLDGVEAAVKLASGTPEYLARLKDAALKGAKGREWKALIDEGIGAATTKEGAELLGVFRKNRKALKDIYNLTEKFAGETIPDVLRLQPTLRGRLMAGQVNPLIRIERPFALTREVLGKVGMIGENSMFAIKNGDRFLWTPVSDSFVLGGGKIAESILAKTGLQKGYQTVADAVNPTVSLEDLAKAGDFAIEVDAERLVTNADITNKMLMGILGPTNPRDHDWLLRQVEGATDDQIRGLATELGLDPSEKNLERVQEFLHNAAEKWGALEDNRRLLQTEEKFRALVEAADAGDVTFRNLSAEMNATANEAFAPFWKEARRATNPANWASDPAGLGNAMHGAQGMLNLIGKSHQEHVADVIRKATRSSQPKIQGGRKLERAYRETMRFVREHPDIWVRDESGILKLSREALEKVRGGEEAGRLALFEEHLARASRNGIDMQAVLERHGLYGGMTEVFDMTAALDDVMELAAVRHGTIEEQVKNHVRRRIRLKKKGYAPLGDKTIQATVGGTEAAQLEEFLEDVLDDVYKADPSLAKVKSPEGIQKLRRATEKQLVAAEKLGKIEFEWDTLATFSDQMVQHQRAMISRQLVDDMGVNQQLVDWDAIETMNKTADYDWVPDFLKVGREKISKETVAGKIPVVMKAEMRTVVGEDGTRIEKLLEPHEFMDQVGWKTNSRRIFDSAYDKVEVRGGLEILDEFSQAQSALVRGAAEDPKFVAAKVREDLLADLRGGVSDAADVVDTRGGGRFFHGSAEPVGELVEGAPFSGKNVYGEGFHSTDDLSTAAGYELKNKKGAANFSPTVSKITERQPVKFYDLDAPMSTKLREAIQERVQWLDAAEIPAREMDEGTSLAKFLDEVRSESREAGNSSDQVSEWIETIKDWLEENGKFGGFKHAGGKLTGGRKHSVRIYWHPDKQIKLTEMARGAVESARLPRASKGVSPRNERVLERIFNSRNPLTKNNKPISDRVMEEIVSGKGVPRSIREPGKVRERVAKEIADREAKFREGLLAKAAPKKADKKTLYVLKPMAGHLKDVLGLWDKHGYGTNQGVSGFARWYRTWNHRMKGAILNMSAFHLNTISFASQLLDPGSALKFMRDPMFKDYRKTLLTQQGLGAAGGALIGGALGDDEEDAIFGGIVGLFYGTAIGAALGQSKLAKNFMFDPKMAPYMARAGRAGFYGRPDDRSIGVVARYAQGLADKIKSKHGETLTSRLLDGAYAGQVEFERVMWDWAHNGHKVNAFVALAQQNDQRLAKMGLEEGGKKWNTLQREFDLASMQVVNSALGGHSASKLWNDPQWQRRAQDFLMSPDWTIGNFLGAGNIFLNQSLAKRAAQGAAIGTVAELASAGFDLNELSGVGTLGGAGVASLAGHFAQRAMARIMVREAGGNVARAQSLKLYRNAILGGYFFGNLVNYMNTGHFMWDNPEGKELGVALPGGQTFVTLGKPYTETLEFAGAIERDKVPVPILSRAASKASPLGRFGVQFLTNRNYWGGQIWTADAGLKGITDLGGWAASQVLPISMEGLGSAAFDIAGGGELRPRQRIAAETVSALGFAVSRERGTGLEPFLSGALSVAGGVNLQGLQRAPSLGDLARRNLAVGQRDVR